MPSQPHILLIDNYDSFTFNLVHLLERVGASIEVVRNDEVKDEEVVNADRILLSPGPGLPQDAGRLMEVLPIIPQSTPVMGVCLGMQAMLEREGAVMSNLDVVAHGAKDAISVKSSRLFDGLPTSIQVGRYHSWGFKQADIPKGYNSIAESSDGYVMAVEHMRLPRCGVQFHPESVMTECGAEMMLNWLAMS